MSVMANHADSKMSNQQHQPEIVPLPDYGHNVVMVPQYNPQLAQTNAHHLQGMVSGQVPYMGQQPMYHQHYPMASAMTLTQAQTTQQPQIRNWSTGLLSCFDDFSSCILGTFCPCILAMTISCSMNECCCAGNCYPVALRTKIRTQHNITGSICEDGYMMCVCHSCALCQIAREIDATSSEN